MGYTPLEALWTTEALLKGALHSKKLKLGLKESQKNPMRSKTL
jgi:hypothetical protein